MKYLRLNNNFRVLHRKETDVDRKYSKIIFKNVFSMQQKINDNRIKMGV